MFKNTQAYSGFSVNDIPRAKAFYGDLLGLNVSEQGGLLHLKIAGGIPVLVYPKKDHTPATYTVLNFPVDHIEQTMEELARKGITFERYPSFDQDEKGMAIIGGALKQAWFKDPAGNILSLIQEL